MAHLKNANENYFEHLLFAFRVGLCMFVSGILTILHAIFPFLFETVATEVIDELSKRLSDRNYRNKL